MTRQFVLLAGHEWTLLARSRVALVLAASFATLTAAALVLGSLRVSREMSDAAILAESASAAAPTVEHLANEHGTFAVLPPAPLLGFAVGQTDVHPTHYRITARASDAQLSGDQLQHPLALYTGQFDLAFVIVYFYPLLIVAICHDLMASERAAGTLSLMLVHGASMRTLAAGKTLARLLTVVAIPVLTTAIALAPGGGSATSSGRMVLWTFVAIAYGLFWLGLAVHVNARGRSAAGNALTLAGAWLTLVVLVPSFVNLATRVLYPVPSRVELATTLREATRQAIAEGSRTLGRYLEDHPSTGTGMEGMRQYYALQYVRDARVAQRARPLLDAFQRQLARQAEAVSVLQYLSPALVAQLALTDAAGTSGHRAKRFDDQATSFQQAWRDHFPPDVLAGVAPMNPQLPAFEFIEEPIRAVLRRVATPVVALAVVAVIVVGTGIRAFGRFSVTGA